MSEYTKHYNLKKPTQSENYNVEDANLNNEIIDNALYGKADKEPGKGMSTNDFTDNYKKKIDTMQTLYKPMGTVNTVQALQSITTKKVGDLYRCKQDENNYVWNGQEWVNIGQDADYSELTQQIEQVKQSQDELVDDMSKTFTGTNITAPTVAGVGRTNKVYGFCRQETREGRNLLPIIPAQSKTANGITLTSNGDGSYSVSGTATANASIFLDFDNSITLPNGTLYCHLRNNVVANCALLLEKSSVFSSSFSTINRIASSEKLSNLNVTSVGIYVVSGATINATFKPSVEVKSEITEYEAYGASPSPDYPAKVHCLGDDVNLFDGELELGIINGNTGANLSNPSYIRGKNYIAVDELSNYKISTDNANIKEVFIFEYDKDYNYNLTTNKSLLLSNYLITNKGTKYIRFRPNIQTTDTLIKFKVQKDTVATPWSPYMHGTIINKSTNKNLLDLTKCAFKNCTLNSDGSITSNINNYYYSSITTVELNDFLFENRGKQITFFIGKNLDSTTITIHGSRKNGANYQEAMKNGESVTMTISNDFTEIISLEMRFNRKTTPFTDTTTTIPYTQLEEESVPTGYVPHEENTQVTYVKEPLCVIDDVQDELDLTNKQTIRRLGKKVFDGTENIVTNGTTKQGLFRYDLIINTMKANAKAISSHFKTILLTNVDELSEACISTHGSESKVIFWTNFTTLTDFKAFLAEQYTNGTPVEVIYELAEPIIESIDCTDKIAQFDGQTTVYNVDGAELECSLTNNRAIAEVNENLHRIEGQINKIEENTKLENITKNIRGHFEFIENSDANKLTKVGLYRLTGTLTNYPSTSSGILEVNGSEDIAIEQIFTQHNGKKWNRICWYGTWSSWLTMN